MPTIPYPNVPDVPGVPAIPRSPNFPPVAGLVLDGVQGALWRAVGVEQKWGIWTMKGDKPDKLFADPSLFPGMLGVAVQTFGGLLPFNAIGSATLSVGSVDYSKEMKVADFPVERGGFASYNKVEQPAVATLVVNFSGTETERQTFINLVESATLSTELFAVVTPEKTYLNYTMESYSYRRSRDGGAYMYVVEIPMREIRQVTSSYSVANPGNVGETKQSSAQPPVDNGKTQPTAPKQSVFKSLVNKGVEIGDNVLRALGGG